MLAVRISREGFDAILSKALTGKVEKERGLKTRTEVRLQWDPDHTPSGASEKRRAIQLGLRDEVSVIMIICYSQRYKCRLVKEGVRWGGEEEATKR